MRDNCSHKSHSCFIYYSNTHLLSDEQTGFPLKKKNVHDGNETQIVHRNIAKICVMRRSLDPLALFYNILCISLLLITFKMAIFSIFINIMDSNWFFNYRCHQFPVICSLHDIQSIHINSIKIVLHNHCSTINSIKSKKCETRKKSEKKNQEVQ